MSSSSVKRIDGKKRVGVEQADFTFNFESGDTTEQQETLGGWDGRIEEIIAAMGSTGGAVITFTLTIKDKDDRTIFSTSGLAEGSETDFSVSKPVLGDLKVGITPSGDPLADVECKVHVKGV